MTVFDKIRSSCAYLAERAESVQINHDFLAEYTRQLPVEIAQNPVMETENHFCGDAEATLAYFITLDSINFGSGYFGSIRKKKEKTGYSLRSPAITALWPWGSCTGSYTI